MKDTEVPEINSGREPKSVTKLWQFWSTWPIEQTYLRYGFVGPKFHSFFGGLSVGGQNHRTAPTSIDGRRPALSRVYAGISSAWKSGVGSSLGTQSNAEDA